MVFYPVFVYARSGLTATRPVHPRRRRRARRLDAAGGSGSSSCPRPCPTSPAASAIAAGSAVIAAVVGESLIGRERPRRRVLLRLPAARPAPRLRRRARHRRRVGRRVRRRRLARAGRPRAGGPDLRRSVRTTRRPTESRIPCRPTSVTPTEQDRPDERPNRPHRCSAAPSPPSALAHSRRAGTTTTTRRPTTTEEAPAGTTEADGATTTEGAAATTTQAGDATTTAASGEAFGTVRTQFNWVPDIEWSAWYLADANGHFADHGVDVRARPRRPEHAAVAQVLAAGEADIGLAGDELEIINANNEGADYVALGAMYQRSPFGLTLAGRHRRSPRRGPRRQADRRRRRATRSSIDAMFRVNGLEPDYEFVPMSFDPQPLVDGEMDAITCVRDQPADPAAAAGRRGRGRRRSPTSGCKSYGDVIFASQAVRRREPRPGGRLPRRPARRGRRQRRRPDGRRCRCSWTTYGADTEIDEDVRRAGNPAYIALMTSDFTEANGLLSMDPDYLENEVCPGATRRPARPNLPTVDEFFDALAARRRPRDEGELPTMRITAVDPLELGYRKVDPPMARSFAVVRVETDTGLVGWGEASTNWGHSYPTVFSAAVRDVCAGAAARHRPDRRPRPAGPAARAARRLPRLGGARRARSSRRSRSPAGTSSARRSDVPIHRLLGAASTVRCALYGTGTTMFEEDAVVPRPLLRPGARARLHGVQGPSRAAAWPTTSPRSPPSATTSVPTR